MSEHLVRRGEPARSAPRTFEQRPTTKLDSHQLLELLSSPEPVSHAELEAEIEIVAPVVDVTVPVRVDVPISAPHVTRWPVVVFALVAAAWIVGSIAGL